MALPILGLNLAPHPTFWRHRHKPLGWAVLTLGSLFLLGALVFTWRAYHQAGRAGRDAVSLTEETHRVARRERNLQATLQDIDAAKEQSQWKLAEHILQERSLPWSRLTAELERCMVPDMRLRSIQRVRGTGQQVVMKLKGEARTVAAETAFVGKLRSAPVFDQVILEREAERQGGGWDFELTLPVAAIPPPFQQAAQTPTSNAAPSKTIPSPGMSTPATPAPKEAPAGKTAPAPRLKGGFPESIQARPVAPAQRRPGHRQPDPRGDRSSE